MIKTEKAQNTFVKGIDTDVSVNKVDNTVYFDAVNMRIISNDVSSSGALTNVKGNTLKLVFETGDVIIGSCKIRSNLTGELNKDSMVFFVYNTVAATSKIYLFEGDPYKIAGSISMGGVFADHTTYKSGIIYSNVNLNFNQSYPIKAEGRYESADIRKIYWVDGLNNIRYMILDRVSSGDPVEVFEINPTATLTTPSTQVINGGKYTSGIVQHAYQLYIKNGAATTYSPVSHPLYLSKNNGGIDTRNFSGSELGDSTGCGVQVTLTGLDTNFNRVRIVAIHYTEYLIDPIINIIGEFEFTDTTLRVTDNGYTVYGTIPIDEFRLFGQTDYIANYIASKNNYLFFGDTTEDRWNPSFLDHTDGSFWDLRAVRFKSASTATVFTAEDTPLVLDTDFGDWSTYPYNHDGINKFNNTDYDDNPAYAWKYQSDGATLGAEGPNIEIEFVTEELVIDSYKTNYASITKDLYRTSPVESYKKSSQREETYRIFIVLFNSQMQYSNPQWVCDLRMPSNTEYLFTSANTAGNLVGNYLFPKVTIKNIPDDVYGWQVYRCERESTDRSVLANGLVSPCASDSLTIDGVPTVVARPFSSTTTNTAPYRALPYLAGVWPSPLNKKVIEVLSPEIAFNKNLYWINSDKIRVEGRLAQAYVEDVTVNPTGSQNDRQFTINMGLASGKSAGDTTVNYNLVDGSFQAPGIIYGAPTYPASTIYSGGINFKNILRYDYDSDNRFHGNRGSNFIAILGSDMTLDVMNGGYIYGSYVRNVFNTQYNGNSYESRTYNSAIPYSDFTLKTTTSLTCYHGDTFITMFAYLRSSVPDIDYDDSGNDNRYQQEMIYFPCESSINCFYRLDELQKYYSPTSNTIMLQETLEQGLVLQPTTYPIELGDLYRYNPVYSKSSSANRIQCMLFDSNIIEHSDVKILATGKKINNEYYDNWTNLYSNNYIELDPAFGSIRNLFNFNNRLFAGQDKAIAALSVEDRSLIQDNNKAALTLGTGTVLSRYDYLTTTSGFQNYYDMVMSDKAFYYLDRRNKIIYNLTSEGDVPISEINGYRSYLKLFGNITNVKTGFDPVYKDIFFHITDGVITSTSVYNEYTRTFVSKQTFSPSRMFHLNDQFYSIDGINCYLHNYGNYGEFYGVTSDSSLTVIINPNGNIVKRFDILDLRVDVIDNGVYQEKEQFNEINLNNNYQTIAKTISFTGDDSAIDTSKTLARQWRVWLVPDDNSTEFYRMVDTYIKAQFVRNNDDNKKLVFHDIVTYFRNIKG